MRQALELALDWIKKQPEETPDSKYDVDTRYVVIREIEAALAQPDQDEVDIRSRLYQRIHELETQLARGEQDWIERERAVGYREGHQNALKQMAQPEQEPVAWVVYSSAENDIVWADKGKRLKQNTPLYTTPPQRTWVGLTDEERKDLCRSWSSPMDAIYATEAKLKDKNERISP